ncbi:hypothetical protein ACFXKH_33055 [Streptomyces caelestis]|uniref:hypothetical protein n=1 Tax=Streptomyces caelestis TaxID=36816 RepID=UPI00368361FA
MEAAARERLPVLRVTPHPDLDSCGHRSAHLAYTVCWSVPTNTKQCILHTETEGEHSLAWHDITRLETLIATTLPPAEIKDRTKERAGAEPINPLDASDYTPEQIALLGGDERAARFVQDRNRPHTAPRTEWTDRADWAELARQL